MPRISVVHVPGLPRVMDLVEGAAATMLADCNDRRQAEERRQSELP